MFVKICFLLLLLSINVGKTFVLRTFWSTLPHFHQFRLIFKLSLQFEKPPRPVVYVVKLGFTCYLFLCITLFFAKKGFIFGNKSVPFALIWGCLPQMKCILTQDLVCRINVNVLKAMVGNLWGRGIKWSIDAACFFLHIETFPLCICW